MEWLNQLRKMFHPPSAEVLAVRQLEETKRLLLEAYAYQEEAEALVRKYQDRLKRLEAVVRKITSEKN